jgi:hypothetical protein
MMRHMMVRMRHLRRRIAGRDGIGTMAPMTGMTGMAGMRRLVRSRRALTLEIGQQATIGLLELLDPGFQRFDTRIGFVIGECDRSRRRKRQCTHAQRQKFSFHSVPLEMCRPDEPLAPFKRHR